MDYWISWWHSPDMGEFELHSPWWVTGARVDGSAVSICAAVRVSEAEPVTAEEIIYAAYDDRPETIEFRFAEIKPENWPGPFGDRFERANWMQWPPASDRRSTP